MLMDECGNWELSWQPVKCYKEVVIVIGLLRRCCLGMGCRGRGSARRGSVTMSSPDSRKMTRGEGGICRGCRRRIFLQEMKKALS